MTKRNPNNHAHPTLRDAVDVTRFWSLVDSAGGDNSCWNWLGDTDKDGYGVFMFHGRRCPAHELALSFTTGEVRLPVLDTCHSCDNPSCCNPAHLRFDTRRGNVQDMIRRGRANNNSAKITAEDVVMIRERRAAGAKQQDLANQYGLTDGTISMIVRGLRWASAGGPIQPERTHK